MRPGAPDRPWNRTCPDAGVGVHGVEDLRAWQLARAFRLEVHALVRGSPGARADAWFRDQLCHAASRGEADIAEGFRRYRARDFARFLSYAIASLEEAVRRVQDGIDRGHFDAARSRRALRLGQEAGRTSIGLRRSLRQFIEDKAAKPHLGRTGGLSG
jgi:four helix bundle protein